MPASEVAAEQAYTSEEVAAGVRLAQELERLYPQQAGLTRKVHGLWSTATYAYFRVNFHNPENQNYIESSFFVQIARSAETPAPVSKKKGKSC